MACFLRPVGWMVSANSAEEEEDTQCVLCRMLVRLSESASKIEFCLKILSDFSWKLYFFGKPVQLNT